MRLVELSGKDKHAYNSFVAAQESGSFLQSWEWGEWHESLRRKVSRFFILNDNQQTVASIQLIKMPLLFGRCYFYCPYGPTLIPPSPNERGEGERVNFQTIFNDLISKFPKVIFIRAEPKSEIFSLSSIAKKSINIQPRKTLILDLTKSEEELLSEMHPKTRYNIRLAQKHKVIIEKDLAVTPRHGLYFKEVLQQIIETTKRQGYKGYSKDYYINLINFFALKNQGSGLKIHIYKALFQKQLLASGLMVDFGNTRTYLFGGSAQNYKTVMAPHLLHWQAMIDAKKQDYKFYDFWGIETSSGKTAGFARFKLGFASQSDLESLSRQIKNYPGAYDIVQDKVWYLLYRILRFLHRLVK